MDELSSRDNITLHVGTRARDGREISPERVSCVVNGSRAAREKMTEEETESLEKGGGGGGRS